MDKISLKLGVWAFLEEAEFELENLLHMFLMSKNEG